MKRLVEVVSELGSDFYGGVIYAPLGRFVGRGPNKTEISYSVEALRKVAKYAKQFGINLGIEPANRYETYVINTIEDGLKLAKNINESNVGLLVDTYHMNIEEKHIYRSILKAYGKIIHMHANENDRGAPGSGHIDWDEVFRGVKDINYSRFITIESFVDCTVDIASTACIWRKLAESPENLAREGLSFLKSMSEKYNV